MLAARSHEVKNNRKPAKGLSKETELLGSPHPFSRAILLDIALDGLRFHASRM